jgi:hypothetical protein
MSRSPFDSFNSIVNITNMTEAVKCEPLCVETKRYKSRSITILLKCYKSEEKEK